MEEKPATPEDSDPFVLGAERLAGIGGEVVRKPGLVAFTLPVRGGLFFCKRSRFDGAYGSICSGRVRTATGERPNAWMPSGDMIAAMASANPAEAALAVYEKWLKIREKA